MPGPVAKVSNHVVEVLGSWTARAKVSQDVVEVLFADPGLGSLPTGASANQSYTLAASTLEVTGQTETVLTGCDLTATGSPTVVGIDINMWISQYRPGTAKAATLRLRRTSVTGTALASANAPDAGDSQVGHQYNWVTTYNDASPTDYRYVITAQETAGNASTEIWSNSILFKLYTDPANAIVSSDVVEVLVQQDPSVRVGQNVIEVLTSGDGYAPAEGSGGVKSYGYAS